MHRRSFCLHVWTNSTFFGYFAIFRHLQNQFVVAQPPLLTILCHRQNAGKIFKGSHANMKVRPGRALSVPQRTKAGKPSLACRNTVEFASVQRRPEHKGLGVGRGPFHCVVGVKKDRQASQFLIESHRLKVRLAVHARRLHGFFIPGLAGMLVFN